MTDVPTLPLLDRHPTLSLPPSAGIARLPTPVEKLPDSIRESGGAELWVKRDDLTNPEYGGNKVRKLDFLLGEAQSRGVKEVVTVGGIGSNHALATAINCRKMGLNCRLFLFPQPVTDHVRMSLRLYHAFGASMHVAQGYGMLAARVAIHLGISRLRGGRNQSYYVPGGGSSALGALGYVNAAFELQQQVAAGLLPEPETIICALGTGGTLAGLHVGLRLAGLKSKVLGVRVTPTAVANRRRTAKLANSTQAFLTELGCPAKMTRFLPKDIAVDHNYYGGCYGDVTPESVEAVALAAAAGVKLETTYTGKAFAAALHFARSCRAKGPILFWNTFNSADMSALAKTVDRRDLPREFHPLFSA